MYSNNTGAAQDIQSEKEFLDLHYFDLNLLKITRNNTISMASLTVD